MTVPSVARLSAASATPLAQRAGERRRVRSCVCEEEEGGRAHVCAMPVLWPEEGVGVLAARLSCAAQRPREELWWCGAGYALRVPMIAG